MRQPFPTQGESWSLPRSRSDPGTGHFGQVFMSVLGLHDHHGRGVIAGVVVTTATPSAGTAATPTRAAPGRPVGGLAPAEPPRAEVLPGAESLGGPDPHAAGDAYDQGHEDLEHVHLHRGDGLVQRALRLRQARPPPGLVLPPPEVHPLVEVAADDAGGGHRVQHGEHPDLGHQLLQLADVGAAAPVLLQVRADSEERHEAGQDEDGAHDEVDDERGEDEAGQGPDVLVAHVAHAGQLVPVHPPHGQDDDGLDGRDGPGGQVEVGAQRLDGLLAPLPARGQEPGQGEDDPPDGGGHAEEVEDEEDDDAPGGLQPFLNEELLAVAALVAGDGLGPRHGADHEGHGVNGVAHG